MATDLDIFKKALPLADLEKAVSGFDQVECPMTHHFSPGIYVRERFAKADTLIIGKRHRHDTMSILLQGTLSVYLDEGGAVKLLKAPCIWTTKARAKRMTYSHTDTILATIHPTEETDLEKLEEDLVIPEKEYLEQGGLK